MTNDEVVTAALEWVVALLPALEGHSYDHIPAEKIHRLPDVIGDLGFESVVREHEEFPISQLQQVAGLRVFQLGFSFMVESGMDGDGAAAATAELRSFAEALTLGVLADTTLGGRVPFASPFVEFDYTPPFVEYADGTRGREMTMQLAVAEPLHTVD